MGDAAFEIFSTEDAIKKVEDGVGKNKNASIIISTINFEKDTESRQISCLEHIIYLIKKAKTIVFCDDNYFPHMELYSVFQKNLNDVKRNGTVHNIIWFGK